MESMLVSHQILKEKESCPYGHDGINEYLLLRDNIALKTCESDTGARSLFFEQRLRIGREYITCKYVRKNIGVIIFQTFIEVHSDIGKLYPFDESPPVELFKTWFKIISVNGDWYYVRTVHPENLKTLGIVTELEEFPGKLYRVKFTPKLKLGFDLQQNMNGIIFDLFHKHPLLKSN